VDSTPAATNRARSARSAVQAATPGDRFIRVTSDRLRPLRRAALAALLALAVVLLVRADPRRYEELLSHGTRTTGTVQTAHQDGRGLAIFRSRTHVGYRAGDVPHSTTVWLDEGAPRYTRGQSVPVVYDPDRPTVATVVGEWNVVWWRRMAEWLLGAGAVIAAGFALAARRRARGPAWG
jgi:hypothetical protein